MARTSPWRTGDDAWDQADPAELHARCLRFEEGGWALVMSRVRAICCQRRFGFSPAERDDMAQDVVLHLMNRVGSVRIPEAFKALVRRIAINRILDRVRVPDRLVASLDVEGDHPGAVAGKALEASDPSPEEHAIGADRARAVLGALKRLGEPCRRTLWLWAGSEAGSTYADLARELCEPIGTISSRVTRCLKRLAADPELVDHAVAGRRAQKTARGARPLQRRGRR